MKTLVQALVLSRLDYCNSILANLPDMTLAPLVRVQPSAARLIRNLDKARFCASSHDGTTLAATSFQNNFQIVCVDAWRSLRLGTKIPG